MRQIEKFLFNVSFDEDELARAEEAAKAAIAETQEESFEEIELPTFSEEELAAARAEGFEAGRAEGAREANEALEARIADTLSQLAGRIDTLFNERVATNAALFDDAVNIALAISRKCFPHLTETHALRAIEDMVRDVLAEILEEPRAMIHVHPDLAPSLNERISALAEASNFEGQVLIIDDANMAMADCRVSWSSGSAERDMKALWQRVDEIVEMNVHTLMQPDHDDASESVGGNRAQSPAPVRPSAAGGAKKPAATAPAQAPVQPEAGAQEAPRRQPPRRENNPDINELSPMDENASGSGRMPGGAAMSDDEMDDTAAHLQAGPGIVDAPEDGDILEAEHSEGLDTDQAATGGLDDGDDSAPPRG